MSKNEYQLRMDGNANEKKTRVIGNIQVKLH